MKNLKNIFLFLCSLYWPLSLILANRNDWQKYTVPGCIVLLSLFLYSKSSKKNIAVAILLFVSAILINLNTAIGNSIFIYDPLAYDTQVKKVSQIPSRVLSRVIQNKYYIYSDKFISNMFLNLDTNNYFFSLHPRETGETQNLAKFPFIALPVFIIGFYGFAASGIFFPYIFLFLSFIFLSFFSNFDKYDFILWPFILLFIIKGSDFISQKQSKLSQIYYLFSMPFIFFDLIRILLLKN